jgi:hypothetical protein
MASPKFKYIRLKASENYMISRVYNFVDYKYIYNSRVYELPSETEIVETDRKLKSIDIAGAYTIHTLAAINYKIFSVEVYFTESIDMSVIKSSQEILFTDENGLNYEARIKSDSYEKVEGAYIYRVIFELRIIKSYDVNQSKNAILTSDFSNDFCTSGAISNIYGTSNPTKIVFSGVYSKTFYTKFLPIIERSEIAVETIELKSGKKYNITQASNIQYITRLYLDEDDLVIFQKYYASCTVRLYYNDPLGTNTIVSANPIEVEFVENEQLNSIGIYRVDIVVTDDIYKDYIYG